MYSITHFLQDAECNISSQSRHTGENRSDINCSYNKSLSFGFFLSLLLCSVALSRTFTLTLLFSFFLSFFVLHSLCHSLARSIQLTLSPSRSLPSLFFFPLPLSLSLSLSLCVCVSPTHREHPPPPEPSPPVGSNATLRTQYQVPMKVEHGDGDDHVLYHRQQNVAQGCHLSFSCLLVCLHPRWRAFDWLL